MPRTPGPPSVNRTFRLPAELVEWIESEAERDRRSVNQWIVVQLERAKNLTETP